MSLLPQSKKSSEEIAKLRESFGVLGISQQDTPTQATAKPAIDRRPAEIRPLPEAKPVRSLRKSERVPVQTSAAQPAAHSNLPTHRRSQDEIEDLRKREALARLTPPPPNPKLAVAHRFTISIGYACALSGSSFFFYKPFPLAATASCAVAALLTALYIFLKTPLSKHHAGFITAITLVVMVFGSLHYFPHLKYAT
jgi:hypothetical protein